MRYLVISDTHGNVDAAEKLYKSLTDKEAGEDTSPSSGMDSDIDQIIHLGDCYRDGLQLESRLGVPVIGVKGNMDGSNSPDDYLILDTEYGKIYLSHGHMESVKYSTQNLLYKAASLECKGAFYGHTHRPYYEIVGGIYLFNPGSLTQPRGSFRQGSYGILDTASDKLDINIHFYNYFPESSPRKSGGGKLRDMLNNSDRF